MSGIPCSNRVWERNRKESCRRPWQSSFHLAQRRSGVYNHGRSCLGIINQTGKQRKASGTHRIETRLCRKIFLEVGLRDSPVPPQRRRTNAVMPAVRNRGVNRPRNSCFQKCPRSQNARYLQKRLWYWMEHDNITASLTDFALCCNGTEQALRKADLVSSLSLGPVT